MKMGGLVVETDKVVIMILLFQVILEEARFKVFMEDYIEMRQQEVLQVLNLQEAEEEQVLWVQMEQMVRLEMVAMD